MLLTRCVLFLAFAINYCSEKVLVNSYITSLFITGLLLIKTVSTKIYRAPWMNILEISFLCNLEVLLVTVCYIKGSTIDDSVRDMHNHKCLSYNQFNHLRWHSSIPPDA